MIDTDTRQLKRSPDGHYRSGGGRFPCDHCGLTQECPLKPVDLCKLFMPVLPFTDETGLDRLSNTLRIGKAWTERLTMGQTIALYHPKKKVIFGHARLVGMSRGPIRSMLKAHAHANHLMLQADPKIAADYMFAWMKQNYGPRIVHEETTISALYLLRQYEPPASPDFARYEADWPSESGTTGSR